MARDYRVAVISDEPLVAQCVAAALTHRGFQPALLDWAVDRDGGEAPTSAAPGSVDVGLLICALDDLPTMHQARQQLDRLPAASLVITPAPSGPAWGAMLASGAAAVAGTTASLDETERMLRDIAQSRLHASPVERRLLTEEWHRYEDRLRDLAQRVGALSEREHQILGQLYAGAGVRDIGGRFGVSTATVRSQVRSILRKLRVNSQLGAVALLSELREAGLDTPPLAGGRGLGRGSQL